MTKMQDTISFPGGNNPDRIGGSSMVVTSQNGDKISRVMVDGGIQFPEKDSKYVGYAPDLRRHLSRPGDPAKEPLDMVFLTHPHEDHIGAWVHMVKMGYTLPPFYGSKFTINYLKEVFKNEGVPAPKCVCIDGRDTVKVSDDMEIEAINVSHSSPDSLGYYITTKNSKLLHLGDFNTEQDVPIGKPFDKEHYSEIVNRGITHFMVDSTSMENDTKRISYNEAVEVMVKFAKKFARGRMIIEPVISRSLQYVAVAAKAAAKSNRTIFTAGYSLNLAVKVAEKCGYDLNDIANEGTDSKSKRKVMYSGTAQEFMKKVPRRFRWLLPSGSQNENNSVMSRIAKKIHPYFKIVKNDILAMCQRAIPGNENVVREMLALCTEQGMEVIQNVAFNASKLYKIMLMQRSGHAYPDEIKSLLTEAKSNPKNSDMVVIPVHGNMRQLGLCTKMAREVGVKSTIIPNMHIFKLGKGKVMPAQGVKKIVARWIGIIKKEPKNPEERPIYEYDLLDQDKNILDKLEVAKTYSKKEIASVDEVDEHGMMDEYAEEDEETRKKAQKGKAKKRTRNKNKNNRRKGEPREYRSDEMTNKILQKKFGRRGGSK